MGRYEEPQGMMQYSEADDTREPLPIQAYRGKGESSYWSSAGEKTGEVYLMGVVVSNRGAQPSYGNPAEAIPRGIKPLVSSSSCPLISCQCSSLAKPNCWPEVQSLLTWSSQSAPPREERLRGQIKNPVPCCSHWSLDQRHQYLLGAS